MCKFIKMINYMFLAEQIGVDPSQGERLKCYSLLDMNPDDVSSRKCWKGVRRRAMKIRKSVADKRKRKS